MKKYKIVIVLTIILSIVISSVAVASPATSYTWTINSKGYFTKTQEAYLPETTLISLQLSEPEDIFVDHENILYIADTGNGRIVKYDIDNSKLDSVIELPDFKKPRGIYVTEDDYLYVADSGAEVVFKLTSDGELIDTFDRPTDTAFGNTPFKPMKVSVDSKHNMYIIGEGVLNGIIQLSNGGKFLGYFATNKVTLSFVQELQNFFFTEDQMSNLQSRVPITMTNTFVDKENTVYSTTIGTNAVDRIAKHNTAGKNTFDEHTFAVDDLVDVYVDQNGVIYAASLYGYIWVYTDDGMFVHTFGGRHETEDVAGLFSNLNSIAVDLDGRLWAADSSTSYIQSFIQTDYSKEIYQALDYFKDGKYYEAEELWLSILQKNQMLRLAHDGLGKIYLYTERYEEAMKHLKISNSKYYYSQAYWEIRNEWLQERLSSIIIGLFILILLLNIFKFIDKRKGIFNPIRAFGKKIIGVKLIADILFLFNFIRHPIDSFYDLKYRIKGTYISATIIYFSFFVIYMHSYIGRGFLFSAGPIEEIDFTAVIIGFFSVSLLFVVTNFLVTSINDGEGTLGDIYKLVAYSLGPLIMSVLSVTLLSYILTYNEEFIIKLIEFVGICWFGINILLGLQEVHEYSTKTAIQSIFMSIGFMLIIAIVLLIVILMGEQVYNFFEVIIREVIRNVATH